jgi:TonB family protein
MTAKQFRSLASVFVVQFTLSTVSAFAADVNTLLNQARAARSAHDSAAAEAAFNAAFDRAVSQEMRRLPNVALEFATFLVEQRQPENADALLRRALEAQDSAGEPPAMEIPVLMRLRDIDESRQNVDMPTLDARLVKAWESVAGPESVVVANNLYSLSSSLLKAGQWAEAEQASQREVAILERNYGTDAPSVSFALGPLASIETKLGHDDLAKEARDRASAIRQKTPALNAHAAGGGVKTVPAVISKRDPEYSESARKMRIQGRVMLSLIVEASGEASEVVILLPLGEGLDEKAVEAVKAWRFQPATRDGQSVPVPATVEVNFRLL